MLRTQAAAVIKNCLFFIELSILYFAISILNCSNLFVKGMDQDENYFTLDNTLDTL